MTVFEKTVDEEADTSEQEETPSEYDDYSDVGDLSDFFVWFFGER